jgi:hypothetical protein
MPAQLPAHARAADNVVRKRQAIVAAMASSLIRSTSAQLFEVLIVLLVGVLDAIDAFPEPFSIVPNEICRLQRLCASGCALRSEICGSSLLLTSG